MRVQQILRMKGGGSVETISPQMTVMEAAKKLSEMRIGALILSEDGERPVGILSERDIVRELGKRGPACLEGTVDGLATKKLVTCSAEDDGTELFRLMTEGRFRHLPVLDGEIMIGLISIGDVVKATLSELAMEKNALEGMIMGH